MYQKGPGTTSATRIKVFRQNCWNILKMIKSLKLSYFHVCGNIISENAVYLSTVWTRLRGLKIVGGLLSEVTLTLKIYLRPETVDEPNFQSSHNV